MMPIRTLLGQWAGIAPIQLILAVSNQTRPPRPRRRRFHLLATCTESSAKTSRASAICTSPSIRFGNAPTEPTKPLAVNIDFLPMAAWLLFVTAELLFNEQEKPRCWHAVPQGYIFNPSEDERAWMQRLFWLTFRAERMIMDSVPTWLAHIPS